MVPAFPTRAVGVLMLTGLALAGVALFVHVRANTREAAWALASPPEGRFVLLDGHKIHVVEAGLPPGQGPDLVLIHGANGSLRDFTYDLVGRLGSDFRVIAVDRPGHGFSDSWGIADSTPRDQATILRQALAEAKLSRPIIVGHSYGAAVALAWALEAPDEVGALVLLSGAIMPWSGRVSLFYDLMQSPFGPALRAAVAGLLSEAQARAVARRIFAPNPIPPGYLEHFGLGLALRRSVQEANGRQINALNHALAEMVHEYPRLSLPIELVHGDQDLIVGLGHHSKAFAAIVPSAHLTLLENVGHMPHHALTDAVVAAILRAAERAAAHAMHAKD